MTMSLHDTFILKFKAIRYLFVCLFGFLSHSRIFHSFGDISIFNEGLHILIYTTVTRAVEVSIPGLPRSPTYKANSLSLRHRGGSVKYKIKLKTSFLLIKPILKMLSITCFCLHNFDDAMIWLIDWIVFYAVPTIF